MEMVLILSYFVVSPLLQVFDSIQEILETLKELHYHKA